MNRRDLFEALLRTVGEQCSTFPESALTAFWPMRGHNWKGELMIVGRAVNGWTDPWLPTTAVDPVGRSEILAMTLRASEGEGADCPMLWVSKGWGREVRTIRDGPRSGASFGKPLAGLASAIL